jgi:hypothetical protein
LRTHGIFACPAQGYAADSYLGYCNAGGYGEYDHGAFWFGLEPEAQQAARAADVLFLGNSRMQFGFSSSVTEQWFRALGLRHYLMGFTFQENATFTTPLLARLKPSARVYVIDVDEFFTETETVPGSSLLEGIHTLGHYLERQRWQAVQRPLCGAVPALCGRRIAFFRRRDNGHWQAEGEALEQPETIADAPPADQDQWHRDGDIARAFIARLPVEPRCVVLTVVPSPTTRRAEAQAIADAVGLPLIAPKIEGLKTFDDTHLDGGSAERWSSAFLDAAGADIRHCLAS